MLFVAALQLLPRDEALLRVHLSSEREGIAQVYFNIDGVVSEAASVKRTLRRGENQLDFPIPEGKYRGFRFDPTNTDGSVTVQQVLLWRIGDATPVELLPAMKPQGNVSRYEAVQGGIRVVPTPAVNDAQLVIDWPVQFGDGARSIAIDLLRALFLTLVLALCVRVASSQTLDTRALIGALGLTAGALILTLGVVSSRTGTVHPDEVAHAMALIHHTTNGILPPKVTDPAIFSTISVFGFSYLFEWDIVYPTASMVLYPFGVNPGDPLMAARLFNFSLWCVLFVALLRRQPGTAILAVALISPQVWYVFSYFNGDALPFLLAFAAASLVCDTENGVADYLRDGQWRRRDVLLLALCCGLLLISKRNYLPVVPLLLLWLAMRHLELKWWEVATLLLGIALAGAGTVLNAPMFGSPMPGGTPLLLAGLVVSAVTGIVCCVRLRQQPAQLWPSLQRLAVLSLLIVAVALPRIAWDIHQNGMPSTKREAISHLQEVHAGDDFKASVVERGGGYFGLGIARKGVSLSQVAFEPWNWTFGSVRSAFGVYGFMSIFGPSWLYAVLIANFAFMAMLGLFAARRRFGNQWRSQAALVVGGTLLVALSSLMHSWINDFEPQGRYLFPAFAVIALPLGAAASALPRGVFRFSLVIGAGLSAWGFVTVALRAFGAG